MILYSLCQNCQHKFKSHKKSTHLYNLSKSPYYFVPWNMYSWETRWLMFRQDLLTLKYWLPFCCDSIKNSSMWFPFPLVYEGEQKGSYFKIFIYLQESVFCIYELSSMINAYIIAFTRIIVFHRLFQGFSSK